MYVYTSKVKTSKIIGNFLREKRRQPSWKITILKNDIDCWNWQNSFFYHLWFYSAKPNTFFEKFDKTMTSMEDNNNKWKSA